MANELSRSKSLGARTMYAAMQALKDNGHQLPFVHILEEVKKRVHFNEWELERYESSGAVRWQTVMTFHSIGYVKAGYIVKKKGIWYLTPEGVEDIKLGDIGMMEKTKAAYRAWKLTRDENSESEEPFEQGDLEQSVSLYEIEQIEQKSIEGLKQYIDKKNAYEFQDLVAALLRAMGYFTPFIAPPGKDGGVDIQAYRDPLGTVTPRIKIQVKHKVAAAKVQEMRQLIGLLQRDGDVGIFVSTAGFTPDAVSTARSSHVHIELIDLDRFINLWQEFYQKLSDEDKQLLPLRILYFLDKT